MKGEQNIFTHQTDLLLTLLNRQRHDWMNHLQVLLGYLKLGRPEQGEEYLKRVTELLNHESSLSRINCSALSVFFQTFNALHDDLVLTVELANQVDLSLVEKDKQELFAVITQIVLLAKQHLVKDAFETKHMTVTLLEWEQRIVFRFKLDGMISESGNLEVEKLMERSKQSATEVIDWMRTSNEWRLEIGFPLVAKMR
ncbi:Spo0B domain-containing protein [Brevibacillus fulvus]|uniref:Stage 0 sporulation protein B (Sporulation initiation phosphotransferase) n=1 Tax=Brevibacillus fulvus TaxID=1125967 RepID=A0A939BUV9_9BACL|nr:Spo0B domain-containing protein [Brevibacillus fulvus]MBM7590011.1 stage 0 sporulation protein B (sporulation initiation phosphotransferase) [Brevibacillus fulvus]